MRPDKEEITCLLVGPSKVTANNASSQNQTDKRAGRYLVVKSYTFLSDHIENKREQGGNGVSWHGLGLQTSNIGLGAVYCMVILFSPQAIEAQTQVKIISFSHKTNTKLKPLYSTVNLFGRTPFVFENEQRKAVFLVTLFLCFHRYSTEWKRAFVQYTFYRFRLYFTTALLYTAKHNSV